jgi:hypothetical protein
MKLPIAVVIALGIGLMAPPANAISLDIDGAFLSGGAHPTGVGIKFPGTAVFDLDLTASQEYTISVTGQTNASSSFINFFLDQDGAGGLPEYLLAGNVTFEKGFSTIFLPSFISGGNDFLRITTDGTTNNFSGHIAAVDIAINAAPVPGPIFGAGLPGLVMALAGFVAWRRRRKQAAAA